MHTECIVVFPLQQWLSERSTMLRYTCIAYFFMSRWLLLSVYFYRLSMTELL